MKQPIQQYPFYIIAFILVYSISAKAQQSATIVVHFDENNTRQTIRNFAASDAWGCQFAGNWPEEKKNQMADWLFSMDTFANGNPKGIGLSMWRFNIGAGSAEQGDSSGIRDVWRRAAGFRLNKNGQKSAGLAGQLWFLEAAKKRGVEQFLGFFNSPPVWLTKNGKAYASGGKCNIDSSRYTAFANYAVDVIKKVKQSTGIQFNYLSPVNEPQWDWSDGGQEGCPYTNAEISSLVKQFNNVFLQNKTNTRLLISESGHLKYLLKDDDKPERGKQIHEFFNSSSPLYIGNLPMVAPVVASHSYFSTSPLTQAVALRNAVKNTIKNYKDLEYWQSEYCILGDNAGEIKGNKRDTGMAAALYIARVINTDLTTADAAAWQWWTALSAYDYKDGLVYMDKNETNGNYYDSKMLWVLGNYSRFVRPGMKRIEASFTPAKDVYISGFINPDNKQLVWVLVNAGSIAQTIAFDDDNTSQQHRQMIFYKTDNVENLGKHEVEGTHVTLPAQSVLTVIF